MDVRIYISNLYSISVGFSPDLAISVQMAEDSEDLNGT